jgi:hypothetical protein
MLRFKCPKCATVLTADEAAGRDVTPCPKCGLLVRLKAPAAKAPAKPPPPVEAVRPKVPAPAAARPAAVTPEEPPSVFQFADPSQEVPAAVQAAPAAVRPIDDEPDTEPEPRRRRKRRKRKSQPLGFTAGDGIYLGVVGLLAGLGIAFTVIALYQRDAVLTPVVYGIVLTLVGTVWLYTTALEDGMELVQRPDFMGMRFLVGFWLGAVVLLMFVTAIVYLVTNPVRAWKAGAITVVGYAVTAVGFWILYHPSV